MTEKTSHRRTWTLELDRKITPTNMNGWTWPLISVIFTLSGWSSYCFYLIFWFRSFSTVHDRRCHTILVMFARLMFVGVIFSVIFKFFVHIHSVMSIRSNDLPSLKVFLKNSHNFFVKSWTFESVRTWSFMSTLSQFASVCLNNKQTPKKKKTSNDDIARNGRP